MSRLKPTRISLRFSQVAHCPQKQRFAKHAARKRCGAAAVLGLFLTVGLVTLLAVTLDFGYIRVAETEMRRSADAAAMAAAWELLEQQIAGSSAGETEVAVKDQANQLSLSNLVGKDYLQLAGDHVQLGNYSIDGTWATTEGASTGYGDFNAVKVTLHRQQDNNGELPLFFGALTGRNTQALQVSSTAAMFQTIAGFREPALASETVEILPIALDEPSWLAAVAKATEDVYAYSNGSVARGSDGIFETNLYPRGTGAPGNRGTVDIGDSNNSTADLSRQILHGISQQDFVDLGKPLEFDANGVLLLNGDTGISAGIKDELATLIGKTRIIPIFTEVNGNGNNAMFTIVRFEGVRILDVKLTGKKDLKHVTIQPAKVIARGALIDYSGTHHSTHLVTPVMLVE